MRIISQDGKHSIDFDSVHIWQENRCICATVSGKNIVLGCYADDRRADKVFTDIHSAYSPVDIITTNLSEEQAKVFIGSSNILSRVVQMDNLESGIVLMHTGIYYMPDK